MNYRTKKVFDSFSDSVSISVAPPSVSDMRSDIITGIFTDDNSTAENIDAFVSRWPPSQTPVAYSDWIAVDRGNHGTTAIPHIEKMQAQAETLVSSQSFTVEAIDRIAAENSVLSAKWMIFTYTPKIDEIWARVLKLVCLHRRRGFLKVSPNKEDNSHVICVYVDDFTDQSQVSGLREDLRRIGITWKIGFKLDAYTYLGIYRQNEWGISPTRLIC